MSAKCANAEWEGGVSLTWARDGGSDGITLGSTEAGIHFSRPFRLRQANANVRAFVPGGGAETPMITYLLGIVLRGNLIRLSTFAHAFSEVPTRLIRG